MVGHSHNIIVFSVIIYLSLTSIVKGDNNDTVETEEKIKSLKIMKSEIVNKIIKSINESVKNLEKNNDSIALDGISKLEELQRHVLEINETDGDSGSDSREEVVGKDNRRKAGQKKDIFNDKLEDLYKKKSPKKLKNTLIMQKRVQEWLEQRYKEKAMIKAYKEKMKSLIGKKEKCPRFGIGSKAKSPVTGGKKKGPKSMNRYPCCRKCCKSSYLGCL